MEHELERLGAVDGKSGELYAYLVENKATGVPRGIYMNLFVECKPISYLGERQEPGILIDWLQWRNIRCKRLNARSDPRAEGSFYLGWHDLIKTWQLELEHDAGGWPVRVSYKLSVEFSGYAGDPKPDLRLHGASPVRFVGIIVSDELVGPSCTKAKARSLLEPFCPQARDWAVKRKRGADGKPVSHIFVPRH